MSKECDITLKNLVLAGIGALATSADKSKELFHEFVKKGQSAVEQGKVANEELKRDLKEKVKDCINVTIVKPRTRIGAGSSGGAEPRRSGRRQGQTGGNGEIR